MNDAKFSSSIKYLSSKLGKPESYIKNKCDLLKFGNAVKKLIVSGTEIRKDKLTEDQLLPIKDLAIEHRDPLALIIARDEMPVSDVKKIAKMFKDKDISESTKGKLLYKSGHELVETWSVFQNNRAERAKPAPAKAPAKAQKAEKASTAIDTPLAEQSGLLPSSQSQRDETAGMVLAPIQIKLQQLLSVVQTPTEGDLQSDTSKLDASEKDKFLSDVDTLVEHLEKQLSQWKKVREFAFSK